MTDHTRRTEPYFPTQEEVDRICAQARQMRATAMRNAMARAWRVLRRGMTRKESARTLRHA